LLVLTYRGQNPTASNLVLQLYQDRSAVPSNTASLTNELPELAANFARLIEPPAHWRGAPAEVARRQRAILWALDGDPTLLREQTVEPLHVVAVLPDATPYLPRSVRDRASSAVLDAEFNFTEWRARFTLLAHDDRAAAQLREIIAGWRELAGSLAEMYATTPGRKPLRDAIQNSTIEVVINQVAATVALPAGTVAHLTRLAGGQLAPSAGNGAQLNHRHTPVSATPETNNLPQLLAALKDPQPVTRSQAAGALSKFPAPETVAALCELARDSSPLVRYRAIASLGVIGDRTALPVVFDALGDDDRGVRQRAAVPALERLADRTVPGRLLALAHHPRPATRRLVMYLLARHANDATGPVLQQALNDPDPLVRAEAALALGNLRARLALDDLCGRLTDGDEHVRGAAVYALGQVGERAAAEKLQPLLHDPDPFVRAATAESLRLLGVPNVAPPPWFRAADAFAFPLAPVNKPRSGG
jgi:HEAT repeat protein